MHFDELVTIKYPAEGSRNDFGEPAITMTNRATSVPAHIEPKSSSISYEFAAYIDYNDAPGRNTIEAFVMFLGLNQTIEARDQVVDASSNTYDVIVVRSTKFQKEALLRKIN